jgi:Fe2+ or Zn2+ uptake regulation protein
MSHETMDYEGVLHAAGHRVTPQRVMILDAVCDGGGHTTLKQVYTRVTHMDDTIDRSSIYRTLKLFVELGLVVSAETSAGGRSMRFRSRNRTITWCAGSAARKRRSARKRWRARWPSSASGTALRWTESTSC